MWYNQGNIVFHFFKNNSFDLFMLLECKCNKLQFGVTISYIEVSKQKLHISTSCHVTTKLTEGTQSRSNSFLKCEGIQSDPASPDEELRPGRDYS